MISILLGISHATAENLNQTRAKIFVVKKKEIVIVGGSLPYLIIEEVVVQINFGRVDVIV